MNDPSAEKNGANDPSGYSARAYLRLVFRDPVTIAGVATLVAGWTLVAVSGPGVDSPVSSPVVGGGVVLLGTVLFALGYTRTQWALRETTRTQREANEARQGRERNRR